MALRQIIHIDEEACTGCGECITGCAEGALALVDGKARLVKEQFCDGFGDCIGTCPTGALTIEERESAEFDLGATAEHVRATGGEDAVQRMLAANEAHADEHGRATTTSPSPFAVHPPPHGAGGGCPGARMRVPERPSGARPVATGAATVPGCVNRSELEQWPVQIHLLPVQAPFFHDHELVVLSTCAPIASADVHWRFLRGRAVAVGCPKLDRTEGYVEKLGAILAHNRIPKVLVVRMEVPCCGGLSTIAEQAARLSGRTDLEVEEVTIGVQGDVLGTRRLV